ncbi:MAG: hypothetical protein WBX15_17020 [Thermoanaerobaculia bacterium]
MSVADISRLHSMYVRLSDEFKSLWTFHQFAAGVFKSVFQKPAPYEIRFQEIYEEIRKASDMIQSAFPADALKMMQKSEGELQRAGVQLLKADAEIGASVLRRFFERLRQQDEKIIFNLIKFYFYVDSVNGEQRDKIDFLFTRIGEEYIEDRDEYSTRDSLELRSQMQGLLAIRPIETPSPGQLETLIETIQLIRNEIHRAATFEELSELNLVKRIRELKHRIGDLYFHPDVLLPIIDCNVTAKNRFRKLYLMEEQRIIHDSSKLLANEEAIARSFGQSNPELIGELQRFKEFKEKFDESRATSNVKQDVITRLKASMNSILNQLDHDLVPERDHHDQSPASILLDEAQRTDRIESKFGQDPVLQPYLTRMLSVLEFFPDDASSERIANAPETSGLRLEPWEVAAYQKVFGTRSLVENETEDLMVIFLRAAALRIKVEEEARQLAALPSGGSPTNEFLRSVRETLERARELDAELKAFLHESMFDSESHLLRCLYRSRLRLLRGFSGLWLVHDQYASGPPRRSGEI